MGVYRRLVMFWGLSLCAVGALMWSQAPVGPRRPPAAQRAPAAIQPDVARARVVRPAQRPGSAEGAAGSDDAAAAAAPDGPNGADARVFGEQGSVRRGPLHDGPKLLSAAERARVIIELQRIARVSGVQLGVWIFADVAEQTLVERSLEVAEQLKLGQRGKDDGLLLSVLPAAREARLEVGYGLEHVLPDAICARILRQSFADAGAQGLGGRQLVAVLVAVRGFLEAAVADGSLPPPAARRDAPATQDGGSMLPSIFLAAVLLWVVLSLRGPGGGGGLGGGRRRSGLGGLPLLFGGMQGGFGSGGGGSSSSGDATSGGGGDFGGGGASTKW